MLLLCHLGRSAIALCYWTWRDRLAAKRTRARIAYQLPVRRDPGGVIVG